MQMDSKRGGASGKLEKRESINLGPSSNKRGGMNACSSTGGEEKVFGKRRGQCSQGKRD